LIKQAENAEANAKRAEGYRFLELAGAIGSSDQAYNPLAAISGGLKQVAPLFAQDEAAREKAGLENLLARSSLSRQARDQAMADITGGLGLYKTELEEKGREYTADARLRAARIAADKEKYGGFDIQAMTARANDMAYQQFDKPLSELDPKNRAKILGAAATAQQRDKQAAQFAVVGQRETATSLEDMFRRDNAMRQDMDAATKAANDAILKASDPRSLKYRDLMDSGKQDEAESYLQSLIDKDFQARQRRRAQNKGSETTPTAAPKGSAPASQAAPAPKAAGSSTLSAVDQRALEWANAHPKDERADKIKARLGIR